MKRFLSLFFLYAVAYGQEQEIYFIAIKARGDHEGDLSVYTPLLPPPGRYYADPMVYKYKGESYLFFEDYDYKKGVISFISLDERKEPKVALELPIHLSFPHLFEENGEMYMTPETYGYRAVCLFHAVEFPSKWEKVRVLVQGADFSDPILFREGGYYWLFATIRREQLVIYYAESLSDRFRPHPINYQRLKGRNAGPVYRERGKLIRPVMNCQGGYGRGVLLKEIVRLTPSSFEERVLFSIEPNWAPGLTGTHTYCMGDGFLVYDGRFSSSSEEEAKGAQ